MKVLFLVLVLWNLLLPNQPFSDVTVIGTYNDLFGMKRGVGQNKSVFITSQSGQLVAIGVTNAVSAYATNLSYGIYIVEIIFDDGFPLTKYDCLEVVVVDEPNEVFQIECKQFFWFPYLSK